MPVSSWINSYIPNRLAISPLPATSMAKAIIYFLIQFLLSAFMIGAVDMIAKPGCQSRCGNINISYPFGIGNDCAVAPWANLTCNTKFNPPKLLLPHYIGYEVVEILATEVRVKTQVLTRCYTRSGDLITKGADSLFYIINYPLTFSSTKNKLFVVGCDTTSGMGSYSHEVFDETVIYRRSCISTCESQQNLIDNSTCMSNNGCCQDFILKGHNYFNLSAPQAATDAASTIPSFNPCDSAFIAEQDRFRFKKADLSNVTSLQENTMVLNFAIGNKTCKDVQHDSQSFLCNNNSHCSDGIDQPGYVCICNKGYAGNPYLIPGCQDVDECEDLRNNPCKGILCTNTQGGYQCSCPINFDGDGYTNGSGCYPRSKKIPILQLALGLGFGFLVIIIGTSWVYLVMKRRKLFTLREKFFQQNGGLLLKEKISIQKIFTAKELELATNNYDQRQILGQGGFGTVYKGYLRDLGTFAVKKSKILDKGQIEDFVNEVVILTQVDHRNIVRLLGCCLEAEIPLLVYEFVSNGTLSHHIHEETCNGPISWENRLRIAADSAGALAYLHSSASIPIIHRDVKSANILLDENLTAKVADFGASRLNPTNQTQVSTFVKGTMGYLDPEYFHTSLLTEKSDVYSFGVVLAELLTGEKPLCFERSQEQRNLATHFIISMIGNRLPEILEVGLANDDNTKQVYKVAELTKRCLSLNSQERPSMKEVAAELEALRGFGRYTFHNQRNTVNNRLTSELDLHPTSGCPDDNNSAQYSLEMEMMASIGYPR